MSHMVFCQKLQKEAEGLAKPPYPGAIGERIYEHISQEAWQMWLKQQIMYINEYRLNLSDPNARAMLVQEMEKFLFS
ncbi:MAG: oxidative damage protection protein [Gammaproteobacteria bacterium]